MSDEPPVLIQRDDGVTTLVLNRPHKRNALNPQLNEAMYAALLELRHDDATRVVVITGSGTTFCAGMDLKEWFSQTHPSQPAELRERVHRIGREWRGELLRAFPKPTIASVNGDCYGGGFTIVASCDLAIAVNTANFALSEVNWGHVPAGEITKAFGEHLSPKEFLYHALMGDEFDGEEARRIGFVNKAVDAADLAEATKALARELADKDPATLTAIKEVHYYMRRTTDWDSTYRFSLLRSAELVATHGGGRPGIDQFLEKKYRPAHESYDWRSPEQGSTEAGGAR